MELQKYKADLEALIKRGDDLLWAMWHNHDAADFEKQLKDGAYKDEEVKKIVKGLPDFRGKYQSWYSEALGLIMQLQPARVDDFREYYKPLKPRKAVEYGTYTVSDYLEGLTVTRGSSQDKIVGPDAAIPKFQQQLAMVKGLKKRFESSLFDIRTLVQADLFDSEVDVAGELLKKGFGRAAGAVCGVVLEAHFAEVCSQHKVTVKKNPTIVDYNDALKNAEIIDTPTWRGIQYLADLRNLCDHKRDAEPTAQQVQELIDGTRKTIKTVL